MTSFDVMGPGTSVGAPRRRKVAISALAQGLVLSASFGKYDRFERSRAAGECRAVRKRGLNVLLSESVAAP